MSLPNGFWPVVQTFGIDQYQVVKQNPFTEYWRPYFANDTVNNTNWPVFIEAVAMPRSQLPPGVMPGVGDLLDIWPRQLVYYGGPIARYYAPQYRKLFEDWARSQGMVADTDIIPVQPNTSGMAHPSTNFAWYVARNEQRPQKRYRYLRRFGSPAFSWIDYSFDTWKYSNFHRQNPNVT